MTEWQDPEFRFRLALQAARLGIWEYDLTTGRGRRSPELRALLGDSDDSGPLELALRHVHEDDRDRVIQALHTLADGTDNDGYVEFRFRHPDGQILTLEQQVFVERAADGRPLHLYSLVRDVSRSRQTELDLQQLNATLEQRVLDRTRALEGERAALDAFVAFTEMSGAQLEAQVLAQHAIEALEQTLPAVSVVYLERRGERWYGQAISPSLHGAVRAQLEAGVPMKSSVVAENIEQGAPVFLPEWNGAREGLDALADFHSAALFPCIVDGQPSGLLVMGRAVPGWSARDQAVFRAVGRSLTIALERAAAAAHVMAQNEELEARSQALSAFTALTRDLNLLEDPAQLIRRAQEVVLSMLPPGVAFYSELDGDVWRCRTQTGAVGHADLQAMIDAGLPFATTPSISIPWTTGEAHFQEAYDGAADHLQAHSSGVRTTATVPVRVGHRVAGVLGVALFDHWRWTPTRRAVVETTVHSLGLALERAEQARQLDEERASLAAFTAFTESVGNETDVTALVSRAMTLLGEMRAVDAAYFEREDECFVLREWTPGVPPALLARAVRGIDAEQPTFARATASQQAVFVDDWNAEEQGLAESGVYGAVALHPFVERGTVTGALFIGSGSGPRWPERDRKIFSAMGRSLGLALERAAQARQLAVQHDELNARSASLSAANEELEAFSYSVSHDLRTPVRHVIGFVDLTRTALTRGQLDKAHRSLDVVSQAAERMNTLIDGMLELSRAGREGFKPGWTDLEPLVRQAQMDVKREFPDRPIAWQVHAGVRVWGDASLLQQVVTNLLSNAVKYSGRRERSEVTVRAAASPTEWTFTVEDNGVGFDERYVHKLFGVFQRLHTPREFPGTGVGLATVRRIVLKHGGTVFAHSPHESGATFGFTLPRPAGTDAP